MDKYGNTPLHIAAKYGHELLISTLMTNGADTARYGGANPLYARKKCGFVRSEQEFDFFLFISPLPDVGSMECSPCT